MFSFINTFHKLVPSGPTNTMSSGENDGLNQLNSQNSKLNSDWDHVLLIFSRLQKFSQEFDIGKMCKMKSSGKISTEFQKTKKRKTRRKNPKDFPEINFLCLLGKNAELGKILSKEKLRKCYLACRNLNPGLKKLNLKDATFKAYKDIQLTKTAMEYMTKKDTWMFSRAFFNNRVICVQTMTYDYPPERKDAECDCCDLCVCYSRETVCPKKGFHPKATFKDEIAAPSDDYSERDLIYEDYEKLGKCPSSAGEECDCCEECKCCGRSNRNVKRSKFQDEPTRYISEYNDGPDPIDLSNKSTQLNMKKAINQKRTCPTEKCEVGIEGDEKIKILDTNVKMGGPSEDSVDEMEMNMKEAIDAKRTCPTDKCQVGLTGDQEIEIIDSTRQSVYSDRLPSKNTPRASVKTPRASIKTPRSSVRDNMREAIDAKRSCPTEKCEIGLTGDQEIHIVDSTLQREESVYSDRLQLNKKQDKTPRASVKGSARGSVKGSVRGSIKRDSKSSAPGQCDMGISEKFKQIRLNKPITKTAKKPCPPRKSVKEACETDKSVKVPKVESNQEIFVNESNHSNLSNQRVFINTGQRPSMKSGRSGKLGREESKMSRLTYQEDQQATNTDFEDRYESSEDIGYADSNQSDEMEVSDSDIHAYDSDDYVNIDEDKPRQEQTFFKPVSNVSMIGIEKPTPKTIVRSKFKKAKKNPYCPPASNATLIGTDNPGTYKYKVPPSNATLIGLDDPTKGKGQKVKRQEFKEKKGVTSYAGNSPTVRPYIPDFPASENKSVSKPICKPICKPTFSHCKPICKPICFVRRPCVPCIPACPSPCYPTCQPICYPRSHYFHYNVQTEIPKKETKLYCKTLITKEGHMTVCKWEDYLKSNLRNSISDSALNFMKFRGLKCIRYEIEDPVTKITKNNQLCFAEDTPLSKSVQTEKNVWTHQNVNVAKIEYEKNVELENMKVEKKRKMFGKKIKKYEHKSVNTNIKTSHKHIQVSNMNLIKKKSFGHQFNTRKADKSVQTGIKESKYKDASTLTDKLKQNEIRPCQNCREKRLKRSLNIRRMSERIESHKRKYTEINVMTGEERNLAQILNFFGQSWLPKVFQNVLEEKSEKSTLTEDDEFIRKSHIKLIKSMRRLYSNECGKTNESLVTTNRSEKSELDLKHKNVFKAQNKTNSPEKDIPHKYNQLLDC